MTLTRVLHLMYGATGARDEPASLLRHSVPGLAMRGPGATIHIVGATETMLRG